MLRPVAKTLNPLTANSAAMPLPTPREAPVTNAVAIEITIGEKKEKIKFRCFAGDAACTRPFDSSPTLRLARGGHTERFAIIAIPSARWEDFPPNRRDTQTSVY